MTNYLYTVRLGNQGMGFEQIDPSSGIINVTILNYYASAIIANTFNVTETSVYAISSDNYIHKMNIQDNSVAAPVAIQLPPQRLVQSAKFANGNLVVVIANTQDQTSSINYVNPDTGAITPIVAPLVLGGGGWLGYDTNDTDAFFVSADGHLYDFRLSDGQTVSCVPSPHFQSIVAVGTTVFGIGYNAATSQNYISSVDPATGVVNTIASFAFDGNSWRMGSFTTDGTNLYAASSGGHLYSVNILTGAVSSSTSIGTVQELDAYVVSAACYASGTLILTRRGRTKVEDLVIGDEVMTLSRDFKPVRWVGHRRVSLASSGDNADSHLFPIRIRAGALGVDLPQRDLYLSAGHALYYGDHLIPVACLENGLTITTEKDISHIDYHHILLRNHDVVFAEGVPAETYIQQDNISSFSNWQEVFKLGIDVSSNFSDCFPRVCEGPVVEKLRKTLFERALALGFVRTTDPGLTLIVDGMTVPADRIDARHYVFTLSRRPDDVRIVSRSTIPAQLRGTGDTRRLGVALRRIVLHAGEVRLEIGPDHPGLVNGFHGPEDGHRWTTGDARLDTSFFVRMPAGEMTVEVELIDTELSYYIAPVRDAPALTPEDLIAMRGRSFVQIGAI